MFSFTHQSLLRFFRIILSDDQQFQQDANAGTEHPTGGHHDNGNANFRRKCRWI
jgi:hypothetical protein